MIRCVCYRRRNPWLRLALASFILSSFDLAGTCCVPYVEVTVFGTIPYAHHDHGLRCAYINDRDELN